MRPVVLVLLAACGRIGFDDRLVQTSNDAPSPPVFLDAPELAATDAPSQCVSWTARHFEPCALPSPLGGLRLLNSGVYHYDTSTGVLLDPGGNPIPNASLVVASGRVVSVDELLVGFGATLRVEGSRPLIVASWSVITIVGLVSAGSRVGGAQGAGANPFSCTTHAALDGRSDNSGGSGGGGGALRGDGGNGGRGENITGVAGGGAVTMPLLEGGCPGGRGGESGAGGTGAPGAGGGAIQLTAFDGITVTGVITVGGGGGGGGDNDSGGGGGGSGGMIGLEAPMVVTDANATLAANGGGGGGGADGPNNGSNGDDGLGVATRAYGGAGGDNGDGAPGGAGGAGTSLPGASGSGSTLHAGGGGGGGVGYIVIASPSIMGTATFSPNYTVP